MGAWLLATSWGGRTEESIPVGETHNVGFKAATATQCTLPRPHHASATGALNSSSKSPTCSYAERTPSIARNCPATLQAVRHVSVSIDRTPQEVYDFLSDAENFLPKWATGSKAFLTRAEGGWIVESPVGKVKMQFAAKNTLGILDFDFILESGLTIHNPMRVIPNGNGSELIRTVLREPGMSGEGFAEETEWAVKDLARIRELLNR
jgi:hypothetical protein